MTLDATIGLREIRYVEFYEQLEKCCVHNLMCEMAGICKNHESYNSFRKLSLLPFLDVMIGLGYYILKFYEHLENYCIQNLTYDMAGIYKNHESYNTFRKLSFMTFWDVMIGLREV